jgi:glutamate-5-semialdehyde dehydrogenase
MKTIKDQCKKAYIASQTLTSINTETKNQTLLNMANAILKNSFKIIEENKKDLKAGKNNGFSIALLDRLKLNPARLKSIAESLITIANLNDPIGEVMSSWSQSNGLKISKVRVPMGVIGIIYEARPNVTADAIGLSLKAGSSVVLRGSSSAYNSNLAITSILQEATKKSGINPDSIQLLEDTSREGVQELIKLKQYLSIVIPRGGASLIQSVVQNATVPAIETGVGNCHVYVDSEANLNKAIDIIINAKVQRPSVCNACESVLVHEKIAQKLLPELIQKLQNLNVEIRGCKKTKLFGQNITNATEDDWKAEYLDLIIAVKVVSNLNDAIKHILIYGTFHSETIVSENHDNIEKFSREVDAAAILVNASARFVDGSEFGFGAEMGISTQKLHARGPMGLPELTTYKYIVKGNGTIRK